MFAPDKPYRRTKIICTIGPASENLETLKGMMKAGMNVARFNMSHGSYEDHTRRIELVRKAAKELDLPIGLMLDTKGPEVRTRTFKDGKVSLKDGQTYIFTTDECVGDDKRSSCNYANLHVDLVPGDTIMVNDGLVQFLVKEIKGHDIICTCIKGGTISDRKSMNFPNKDLSLPYLSDIDREDILFGVKMDVDFVACSFISTVSNVTQVRELLDSNGGDKIDIISKIENRTGVNNIEQIARASAGIMVARGDMGVEIPFVELPGIQKTIVSLCRTIGRRVVVATEMLESMITNPRPTRAEASDVANAVFDGASAIMLSGETAAGKYPVQVVAAMAGIAAQAEANIDFHDRLMKLDFKIQNIPDSISLATVRSADLLPCKLICVFSRSGRTAKMISRFRPHTPILAFTSDKKTYTKLSMNWGLNMKFISSLNHPDELYTEAEKAARELGLKSGDNIAVTAGVPLSTEANLLKILTLK